MKLKVDEKSHEVKVLQQTVEKKEREQKTVIQEARDVQEELQSKMNLEKSSKLKAQKKASKWKRKDHTIAHRESTLVQKLTDEIIHLESENENLQIQLQKFMDDEEIKLFEGGRYSDEVQQVYYSLLGKGVAIRNIESVIHIVLQKLANRDIGRLPQKILSAQMMVEFEVLAKIHVGETITGSKNNTLHLDGTRKKFNEYASFQLTTGDGSKGLSMGFQDMSSGSASDYMEATKNIFHDIAKLMLPMNADEKDIDGTKAKLLQVFKNVQSDRHIVNKSYFEQLQDYRASFLPQCIENFHDLTAEAISNIVSMNQLFCGMHAINGMGNVCIESLKEFENLAAPEIITHGFKKSTSRSYNLLHEVSKALTTGHDYQKAGVAHYFEPYLQDKGIQNKLVSFRGERINVFFVIAGAAYYHRNHIIDFLDNHCIRKNKLTTTLGDIKEVVFLACFRALGIMGKLITGPPLRLVEEPGSHIFSLNGTWHHVIEKLEEFSMNANPLMEGAEVVLNGKVTKDDIYAELFEDAMDEELDSLTEECLRLLSCACAILLRRQLHDQLPDGKYYQPSGELLEATVGVPKHNIISERDFAQLDRQLLQKPVASTVALSGLICFVNNGTPKYLESLSSEKQSTVIDRAMKEKYGYIVKYREMKRSIKEKKIAQMKAKREKDERDKLSKEKKKDELDGLLMQHGGLWRSEDDLLENKRNIDERKWKIALVTQIRYRKVVLETYVKDKKLLQLTSNRKELSAKELEDNLLCVIKGIEKEPITETVPAHRARNVRQQLIDEHVTKKRKAVSTSSTSGAKRMQLDLPNLVNKFILQKWIKDEKEQ